MTWEIRELDSMAKRLIWIQTRFMETKFHLTRYLSRNIVGNPEAFYSMLTLEVLPIVFHLVEREVS